MKTITKCYQQWVSCDIFFLVRGLFYAKVYFPFFSVQLKVFFYGRTDYFKVWGVFYNKTWDIQPIENKNDA